MQEAGILQAKENLKGSIHNVPWWRACDLSFNTPWGQQEIKHVTTNQKRNAGRNGIVSDGVGYHDMRLNMRDYG